MFFLWVLVETTRFYASVFTYKKEKPANGKQWNRKGQVEKEVKKKQTTKGSDLSISAIGRHITIYFSWSACLYRTF